ncbi:MAG: hypothetical protein WB799_19700 [Candidatus Sulfotelmatobacter sp.]
MTMRVRAVLMVMVALAMMGLAGCDHYNCTSGANFGSSSCTAGGGGSTNNGQTALVYFAGGADELALGGLNVAGSGAFEPVSSFVSPSLPTGVVGMATVNQLYLYVALANETVDGFSIDATTGALTALTNSPYTVGALGSVNSVAADPTGRFLFVAGLGGVSVFSVNSTNGELTLTNGSPSSTGNVVLEQMATDGLGKYLYGVQSFPGTEVVAFSYDSTGTLTAVPGSPFVSTGSANFNMAEIAGESSGKYMIGITEEIGQGGGIIDNHLYVFGISQTAGSAGALAPVAGSPFLTTNSPMYMTVSPNGSFVYTFNQEFASGSNTGTIDPMEGYLLDSSTGALTALTTSFTGLNATIGRFDQSGQYLFATAIGPQNVGETFAYGADTSTGALSNTLTSSVGAPTADFVVTDVVP